MALRRWPPLDTSMAPTQRDAHGIQRERPRLLGQMATIENAATSPQAGAVFSPAHPAGVALPDKERCPPKAEVVSANLVGSANYFNGLASEYRSRPPQWISIG